MKIDIEIGKPEDAEAVAELIRQLGYPVTEADVVKRITQYSQPSYLLLLAKTDGKTIGLIALHIYDVLHLPAPEGRIISFCVDEKLRNSGVGNFLLKEAEDYFRESGCYKIVLNCNLRRTEIHQYYLNRGYQFTSKHFAKFLQH